MIFLVSFAFTSPLQRPLIVREFRASIENPRMLPLGGYTARGNAVQKPGGDDLQARAMVLEQGKERLVIESADMLTIPVSLYDKVKSELPKNVHLWLIATHTHSAPDSQMLNSRMTIAIPGIATFKRKELEWYSNRLAKIDIQALQAKGMIVKKVIGESWMAPCNRGRREFAVPDPVAHRIKFQGENGLETSIFVYGAHPTFYDENNLQTREDWPGGIGNHAFMVLVGAIGDVSPVSPGLEKATAAEKIKNFWKVMWESRKIGLVSSVLWTPSMTGLTIRTGLIPLGKPMPHPTFAKTYHVPQVLANIVVSKFAEPKATMRIFMLGNLAFAGVPGEPSAELGRQITKFGAANGHPTTLVLSHCDGWIGYLLDPKDYDRGGYEATLNFYSREGGEYVVRETNKLLIKQ